MSEPEFIPTRIGPWDICPVRKDAHIRDFFNKFGKDYQFVYAAIIEENHQYYPPKTKYTASLGDTTFTNAVHYSSKKDFKSLEEAKAWADEQLKIYAKDNNLDFQDSKPKPNLKIFLPFSVRSEF